MKLKEALHTLDNMRMFVDIRVHQVVSPDHYDIYSDLIDMIDMLEEDLTSVDCEAAEHDGKGCLGYSYQGDDEPIQTCKYCQKYTGNIE